MQCRQLVCAVAAAAVLATATVLLVVGIGWVVTTVPRTSAVVMVGVGGGWVAAVVAADGMDAVIVVVWGCNDGDADGDCATTPVHQESSVANTSDDLSGS